MAKCWFHLLICFVGIVCGGNGQIVLDDLGLLIRRSGALILSQGLNFGICPCFEDL